MPPYQKYQGPEKLTSRLLHDAVFRKELTTRSLYWFAHVYFPNYIKQRTADFQRQIYHDLENPDILFLEELAFRGSTKTTISTLIFPIWSILTSRKRYVLIVGDTSVQANRYLYNIRAELEGNEALIADWGPFKPSGDDAEWAKTTLVIKSVNERREDARISAHTNGQSVRGLRHRDQRPDLIIADDIESVNEAMQKEQRDKNYNWFKAELMQSGEPLTKTVLIGNLVHSDGLMVRIENEIKAGKIKGLARRYPLVGPDGRALWPAKFPTAKSIAEERARLGEKTWHREAMLRIVPEDGQVIREDWIRYYDTIPALFREMGKGAGVDLAISKKTGADYTAIVVGRSGIEGQSPRIYIEPNPEHARLSMLETVSKAKAIAEASQGMRFFVEAVAYQAAAIEVMQKAWLAVEPMKPMSDKRARLEVVARYVQDGTIIFPRTGCEDLILELTHFGTEAHDDLCLDGDTLVLCERGEVPIRDVTTNDRVMTREGYRRVLWAGRSGVRKVIENIGLVGTPGHPVITKRGIKGLEDINASDIIYTWNRGTSSIEEKRIDATPAQPTGSFASITGTTGKTGSRPSPTIDNCGSTSMGPSRLIPSSIISTATRSTTTSGTSPFSRAQNMHLCMPPNRDEKRRQGALSRRRAKPRAHGTGALQGLHGTESMEPRRGKNGSSYRKNAQHAAGDSMHTSHERPTAPGAAGIGEIVPVYNLTIEGAHEYFANGVLVHNCDAFVYLVMGLTKAGIGEKRVIHI